LSGLRLPERATYWIKTGEDGLGGKTWDAGITVDARKASVIKEVIMPDGKIELTNSAFYTRVFIPPEAYVVLGDFNGDAEPSSGAKRVLKAVETPSMNTTRMALV